MPTIEISVDRFTTIRKNVSNDEVKALGGQKLYVPEYLRDKDRGAPQVDPRSHKILANEEASISILDSDSPKPIPNSNKSDDRHVSSSYSRKVKMFKCRRCGVKSESKKLMKKHIRICKEVNT